MSSLKTWWANHLYPAVGAALAVTLLAGGAVLAAVQRDESPAEQSASSRISETRSAAMLLDFEPAPETVAPDVSAEAETPATSGFEVSCPAAEAIPAQNGDVFDCKLISRGSFSAPVSLTCVKPPAGLTCAPDPATVTPPAGGSVGFHVSLSNNNVKPGKHSFRVVGTSGALTGSFTWPFDTSGSALSSEILPQNDLPFDVVTPSGGNASNDYAITCSPPVTTMTEATANITCDVSSGAFSGAVSLMWLGLDANPPFLTPSPGIIDLQPGGRTSVNLLVNNSNRVVGTFRYVVTVQHNGAYNYSAGGDTDKSRTVVVQVTRAPLPDPPPGMPPFSPA